MSPVLAVPLSDGAPGPQPPLRFADGRARCRLVEAGERGLACAERLRVEPKLRPSPVGSQRRHGFRLRRREGVPGTGAALSFRTGAVFRWWPREAEGVSRVKFLQ